MLRGLAGRGGGVAPAASAATRRGGAAAAVAGVGGTGGWPSVRAAAQQQQQRAFVGKIFSTARLKQLEAIAAKNPNDPTSQARFLRELNKSYPEATLQWINSGKYATNNEAVIKEHIAALALTGKLHLPHVQGMLNAGEGGAVAAAGGGGGMQGMGMGGMGAVGAGSSAQDPLHVTMGAGEGAGWKSQAWKLVRTLGVTFLVLSAVGALMDGGGLGKLGMPASNIHMAEKSDKRFSDVVGVDEAKAELEEIVMYLRDPNKFTRLGGKLPKGMLLLGQPGTGKTLLARAIAGEAGVPFFYTSGSEFEEMFVGVGAKRVRDLFESAKKMSPCIIFIDEIDAIGGSRHLKEQTAMKMTLNQLLVEMDGFEQNQGVIVIAATNFPEGLDAALTRPGRFDRHVSVPLPDILGRKQILELYTKTKKLAKDVNLDVVARGTPGMSGADLANLVNQAALKASVVGAASISMDTLEWAKDKIFMGAERKSAVISEETAKVTAYHEGGHALVALLTKGAQPVHKATIMPRGQALGMVMQLPEGDQTSESRQQMLARLDVCMGGRVAEELILGPEHVTSGASSDLQQANRIARLMVTKFGMNDKIGKMYFDGKSESGELRNTADREIRMMLDESYTRTKELLSKEVANLHLVAKTLMEYETLSGDEIKDLLAGKGVGRETTSSVSKRADAAKKALQERVGGATKKAGAAGRGAGGASPSGPHTPQEADKNKGPSPPPKKPLSKPLV